jgi:integrase
MTESSNPKPVISSSDVESTTDDITFAALLDLYASHKRMKQSTKISYGGFLRNSGLDVAIVRNVTPNTFLEQFNALFAVYPVKARKVAAIVKSLTRWYSNYSGIQVDDPTKLIGTLTGIGIHSSNARTRRLTNDLLPKFWQVLKSRNELERDAITFCLLTAMRKSEVLALTGDNITVMDDCYTVTLPTTKNGKPHVLPLVGTALEVVKRRLIHSPDRLFPTQCKHAFDALKDAGIALSWHDLRRSWASFAVSNGVPDSMVKRVLNHSSDNVTSRHYAHFDNASVANTLLKVERVICADFC